MSMVVGSVTVADDETASGSGATKSVYDATVSSLSLPTVPTLDDTTAPYSVSRPVQQSDIDTVKAARLRVLRDHARMCAMVANLVSYIQANAVVEPGTFAVGGNGVTGTGTVQ